MILVLVGFSRGNDVLVGKLLFFDIDGSREVRLVAVVGLWLLFLLSKV